METPPPSFGKALAGPRSRAGRRGEDHYHDRLLNLLGHKAGSAPPGPSRPALAGTARVAWRPPARPGHRAVGIEAATGAARASFILLLAHDRAGGPAPKPSEVAAARAWLRGFCDERVEEFRAMRAKYGDYAEVLKQRRMDLGIGADLRMTRSCCTGTR